MPIPSNALNIENPGLVYFDGSFSFNGRLPESTDGSINITLGATTIDFKGFSSSNDLHVAKWIVNQSAGNGGNELTIAAALNSASSGDTIFVMPGTYTENLTLKAGVNIVAFEADADTPNVTIVGNCTASFTGTCTLSGIRLQTNNAALLTVSGSNATTVILKDCYINCTNSTGIILSSSGGSNIYLYQCNGNLTTTGISYYTVSGTGSQILFYDGLYQNTGSSTTASTVSSNGKLWARYVEFYNVVTTSNTAATNVEMCMYRNPNNAGITLNGTGGNFWHHCHIESGTASAISIGTGATLKINNTSIETSNASAIAGAGSIQYGNLVFYGTSSLIATTTQIPDVVSNDAIPITTPGAYPYTTIPQDQLILVDTSSGRTITPLASPTTGQKHIIKDNVGSASSNNITITPSGKNIDGAASFVISTNYGSATIVYNGTQWNVI